MITLTITSTAGTVVANATGTSGYVLQAFNPGTVQRANAYAASRWVDGAQLISSKTDVVSLSASIYCYGTSTSDTIAKANAVGAAVDAFDYTVTAAYTGGGSTVYTAMPASYAVEYDPDYLRNNVLVVRLDIPVQP
jgi:hypothetical protein